MGSSLLFSTPSYLNYITLDGTVQPIFSLDVTGTGTTLPSKIYLEHLKTVSVLTLFSPVICTVLNDRIILTSPHRERTQIRYRPAGLLEPLIMGYLACPAGLSLPPESLRSLIGSHFSEQMPTHVQYRT